LNDLTERSFQGTLISCVTFNPVRSLVPLQVRFADNPRQKRLKSVSVVRRHGQAPDKLHYRAPSDPSGLANLEPSSDEFPRDQSFDSGRKSAAVTGSGSTINSLSFPALTQSPISDSSTFRENHGGDSRRGSMLRYVTDRHSEHNNAAIISASASRRQSADSYVHVKRNNITSSRHSVETKSTDLASDMRKLELKNDFNDSTE
jgi:hypothetical protein